MLSLKKKSAVTALSAGLALSLAACGGGDGGNDNPSQQQPEAQASPVAALDSLTGVNTTVTLDPMFVEGITGLGLAPGVTGGAQFDGMAGTVSFPITGGNVTYFEPGSIDEPFVQGSIEHNQSGLTLTKGDTQVELSNFVVDPDESILRGKVLVNGMPFPESGEEVPLFNLDGSNLQPLAVDMSAGTASLSPVAVSLTDTAAGALNMVFMTDALAGGFPVGSAEVTIKLPS